MGYVDDEDRRYADELDWGVDQNAGVVVIEPPTVVVNGTRVLGYAPDTVAPPPPDLEAEQAARSLAADTRYEVQRIKARQAAQAIIRAEGRPPMPALRSLADALAEPDDPVLYRIDGLWPRHGRVVLVAQAKAGKTTVRDNLVRSLVDADPFLDHFQVIEPVRDGCVTIIDAELYPATGRRWLRDQRIRHPKLINVVWLKGHRGGVAAFDLLDAERRAEWAAVLRAAGTRVLIIDCLGPLLAAAGADENSGLDVGRWLGALDALLDEAGITEAVVIHHMGHAADRARGASRLRDWPDAEWRLIKGRDADQDDPTAPRYLAAQGRDVAQPEAALAYDHDGRRLALVGGTRAQSRATKADQDAEAWLPTLAEVVRRHPGLSASEIDERAASVGIGRNEWRRVRNLAVRRQMICQHKAGTTRQNHYLASECAEHAEARHRAPGALPGGLAGV
ncbi:AAA family ATPase [Micromonospora terminaliae]|uniref:AAA family ATPase n=1 Tax=Micromonospora terminaliae TaxID=1914461 RepID=A0AAJ3DN79_9ACTN|nr:AAA family ATPase [Micromonospora terminaliae]NES30065.1 AAA family ATPase [Micromonospora terminaliae]